MTIAGSYQFESLENAPIEANFLAERAQLRLEGFHELLLRHGCPVEGDILEVGAAQGIRTRLIAKNFPRAQVIGVDRSHDLLQLAQSENQNSGRLSHLKFEEGNLYDLQYPDSSFDFIYARLVFMHLMDPMSALKSLPRVLRPGGRILIEDADRDCMFFEPRPLSFPAFWQKVQAGQRRLGGDPNVGRKLSPLMKTVGLEGINVEMQPILGDGADIAFLARTLMPSLNCYLEEQDRVMGESAIKDLLKLAEDPRAIMYHFWFAVSGGLK